MKKMLIIAAMALGVFVAQAAQVSWSAADVGKNGVLLTSNATGWLFNAADYDPDDVEAAMKDGTFSTWTPVGNPGVLDEEEAGYVMGTKKDDASIANSTQYSFFAVIVDGNNLDGASNFIVTSKKTVTTRASGNTTISFGSQSSATWTAIPEPTTVALLTLGLAALGLKRKVA